MKFTSFFLFLLATTSCIIAQTITTDTSNYESIVTYKGKKLKRALHKMTKGHHELTYTEVYSALEFLDRDPDDTTKIICFYSNLRKNAPAQYNKGKGWNREHVWAKSKGDFGTKKGAGTDLHHLRAALVAVNSFRNNRLFDTCSVQYEVNSLPTQCKYTPKKWAWEPSDSKKGDIARMLFYMAIRYEGTKKEPDLEFIDELISKNDSRPLHGKISLLLNWNESDPVDANEKLRNNRIDQFFQHNRNPFIDHPEFASKIWREF